MEADMVRVIGRSTALAIFLALAAPAAWAGGRVGVVLLPPMPVPPGAVAGPMIPGAPPVVMPPSPIGSPAMPPPTLFTLPQAVPVSVPGGGH
jgi:hypothetical protein